MDKQELFQKIVSSINTLNVIEVHGKQNINYMLGCIQTLESVLEDINLDNQEGQKDKKEELKKENK
jgi:hypothetical protein